MRTRSLLAIQWTLLAALGGCGGLLNVPGGKGTYELSLQNSATENLLWADLSVLRGNRREVTVPGRCGSLVAEVRASVSGLFEFEVPCTAGTFEVPFMGAHKFPDDGTYDITFVALDKNGKVKSKTSTAPSPASENSENLARQYQIRVVDLSSAVTISPSPPSSTGESTIDVGGLCSTSAVGLVIQVGQNSPFSCPSTGSWEGEFVSLDMGNNEIPIVWFDPWGNQGQTTLSISRNATGAALMIAGGLSALPIGEVVPFEGAGVGRALLHYTSALVVGVGAAADLSIASVPADEGKVNTGNFSLEYSP